MPLDNHIYQVLISLLIVCRWSGWIYHGQVQPLQRSTQSYLVCKTKIILLVFSHARVTHLAIEQLIHLLVVQEISRPGSGWSSDLSWIHHCNASHFCVQAWFHPPHGPGSFFSPPSICEFMSSSELVIGIRSPISVPTSDGRNGASGERTCPLEFSAQYTLQYDICAPIPWSNSWWGIVKTLFYQMLKSYYKFRHLCVQQWG